MEINDHNTTDSNSGPKQAQEDSSVKTVLDQLQITFPNQISHDLYHNSVQDYYESLNDIIRKLS